MARRGSRKRAARDGSVLCMRMVIDRIREAASEAETAAALIRAGQGDKAFQVALDIEPLLHDANHALQAASMLRRME